jgi:hypothetical protein
MAFHFHIENPQNFHFGEWGWKTIKVGEWDWKTIKGQKSYIIGRESQELQIGITEISKKHIKITETNGKLEIANISTKQGTYVWAQNKGDFIPIASGNTYSVNDGLWIQLSGNPINSSGWRMKHSVRLVVCESPEPDETCWEKLVPPCAIGLTFEDKEKSINEYCDGLLGLSPSTGSTLPPTDPPEAAGINEFRNYAIKKTKYVDIRTSFNRNLSVNIGSWISKLEDVYNIKDGYNETHSFFKKVIISQLVEEIALDFELTIPQIISLISFIYSSYVIPGHSIPPASQIISSFKNELRFFPTRTKDRKTTPYKPHHNIRDEIIRAATASAILLGGNLTDAGKLLGVTDTAFRNWIEGFKLKGEKFHNEIKSWEELLPQNSSAKGIPIPGETFKKINKK